jgi:glycerophosphoryl diester phosphodiesterase
MVLAELPRPIIFAHRGASAYAPENTLAAFELALRQGADAIELDAKLSEDGHVVVIHDQTVDRTTAHTGKVKDLPLSELRKMDAGSHFDVAFRGESLPTLDEVFRAVGQLTYINVELTNYASFLDDLPQKVATLVRRHKLSRRVLFSSFNPIALWKIHRLVPEAPIGLLCLDGSKGALTRSLVGRLLPYQSLHPHFKDLTPGLVEHAHRRDIQVFVYTVNQEEDMQRMFSLGADGIFTDDPVLALQIRETARG